MSQPRLKVSVNVSLADILCIAGPFVTKPSMARHHYKPERHMRKMGFCLQGQGHSNWISVHTTKYDYFCYNYVLNCWFVLATNLVWQCMFISWSVLWKGFFAVFKVKVTVKVWTSVNVCPDNISDRSNLVWWCIIISQTIIQKYHFAMFKIKATIVSTRSSEILTGHKTG